MFNLVALVRVSILSMCSTRNMGSTCQGKPWPSCYCKLHQNEWQVRESADWLVFHPISSVSKPPQTVGHCGNLLVRISKDQGLNRPCCSFWRVFIVVKKISMVSAMLFFVQGEGFKWQRSSTLPIFGLESKCIPCLCCLLSVCVGVFETSSLLSGV